MTLGGDPWLPTSYFLLLTVAGLQVARLLVREYADDLNGVFVQRCSLAV